MAEPDDDTGGGIDLDRKVGPLTLRVWAFVAPVGLALGFLVSRSIRRANEGDAPDAEPVAAYAASNYVTPGRVPVSGGSSAGATGDGIGDGLAPVAPPAVTDNLGWMQAAYRALVARGYDPLAVDVALRLFLEESGLTQRQMEIVGLAIAAVGPPPAPVRPAMLAPPEAPPAPAPARAADVPPPAPPAAAVVPTPTPAPAAPDWVIGPGSTGEDVRKVQFLLKMNNHPEVNVTGQYDDVTGNAIRNFQRFFGFNVTGRLTAYERDALFGMAAARS